jgi:hypothetical protein
VDITGPGEIVLPAPTATAVLGALTEAVRNVERHAAGAPARVVARRDDDEVVTIEVSDDGPGFSGRPRSGGLQVSILDRMVHAGGSAQVASQVGQGTTVTLVWPAAAPSVPDHEPVAHTSRIMALSSSPLLLTAGALGFTQWCQGYVLLGAVWWLLVVAATGVLVWRGARTTAWLMPVLLGVVVVGALLVQVLDHTSEELWLKAWPLLAATPVLLLAVLEPPSRDGVVATALAVGGTLVVGGAEADVVAVVVVVVAMLVLGVSTVWAVRRFGTEVEAAAEAERGQLEEAWRRTVREEVHTRRKGRLEQMIMPFLRRLADTGVRIDEQVRTEAALLEQAVRDEMHMPEVLDPATREVLRSARAAGCRVRVQSDAAAGVPRALVCQVITSALGVEPLPRELTVSVYVTTRRATVAVVALPGCPARRDALEQSVGADIDVLEDDEDATWAEIRLVAATPAAPTGAGAADDDGSSAEG